jgi:hypothetical protein
MSGILDDIAADVSAALAGTLRPVTFWPYALGGDDGFGGEVPTYATSHTCEGVRGAFDAETAQAYGLPVTSAQIELLASSLPVTPKRLDKINIDDGWFIVDEVQLDAAGAWHVLQCSTTEAVA